MIRSTKGLCGIAAVLLAAFNPAAGQDFHLSQYDANPLYINPALTGVNINEGWSYRANLNYRTQWDKFLVGKPFATLAAGFDMPAGSRFALGEFIIDNRSAGGAFNTLNLVLSGAYRITGSESPHHLSVGVQAGLLQKNFNSGNFVYDAQYSPSSSETFDPSLPSGENFRRENVLMPDVNMGFYYRFFSKEKNYSPFLGLSVYHITRPDESFTGAVSRTPMRFVIHGGWYDRMGEKITLLRQILYMNQAGANEVNLGAMVFYRISGVEPMLGLGWRVNDAILFHAGLKQKTGIFRFSYDVNTSYLKRYSNGRGALEFSYVFTAISKKAGVPKPSPDKEENKTEK